MLQILTDTWKGPTSILPGKYSEKIEKRTKYFWSLLRNFVRDVFKKFKIHPIVKCLFWNNLDQMFGKEVHKITKLNLGKKYLKL